MTLSDRTNALLSLLAALEVAARAHAVPDLEKCLVGLRRALTGPRPEAHIAAISFPDRLLVGHLNAVGEALAALPSEAIATLSVTSFASTPTPPGTGADAPLDALALALHATLAAWPEHARTLAVALARLAEDLRAGRLQRNRADLPQDRGFDPLYATRLDYRYRVLPDRPHLVAALHRYPLVLLEDPDEAVRRIERAVGRRLDESERAWVETERRVATLRYVRQLSHKRDHRGYVRAYVRQDARHGYLLERVGMRGHWLVTGNLATADLLRLATTLERLLHMEGLEAPVVVPWNVVFIQPETLLDGATPPDASVETLPLGKVYHLPAALAAEQDSQRLRDGVRAHGAALSGPRSLSEVAAMLRQQPGRRAAAPEVVVGDIVLAAEQGVVTLRERANGLAQPPLALVRPNAADDEYIEFLARLDRVREYRMPIEVISASAEGLPAVALARALLRERSQADAAHSAGSPLRVRLVYIPAAMEHPLGGVPEVGAAYIADHLEARGARVDVLQLPHTEFRRRLPELLGADVVGIGMYLHNQQYAADLVGLLRAAGYRGRIVLGGPATRTIEDVQSAIEGWDAIVRGEAEEVLPAVLDVLDDLEHGRWRAALDGAARLHGVVVRAGGVVLVCDSATQNEADAISCPLPFDWSRGHGDRLTMNFTRGCPYTCPFCPNHQGRKFRSGLADTLWAYSVAAVADRLALPTDLASRLAARICGALAVDATPSLEVALALLVRCGAPKALLEDLAAALAPALAPGVLSDRDLLATTLGIPTTVQDVLASLAGPSVAGYGIKRFWLALKTAALASRQQWLHNGVGQLPGPMQALLDTPQPPVFVLQTSEDNTLVNHDEISDYVARRTRYGLDRYFIFHPGQNTVRDLTARSLSDWAANDDYIARLADRNPFAIALGVDGTSNAVLRQTGKPNYKIGHVLAVNKALAQRGVEVVNNYILLAPESDLLDAIEAFCLFLLLPITWRNHDTKDAKAINFRVIREETTLATDESILFAPEDRGYDCVFRFDEVQRLAERWGLSSRIASADIREVLWEVLEHDAEAAAMLPLVFARWQANLDNDPEIAALSRLIETALQRGESAFGALRAVAQRVTRAAVRDGRTVATFRDLAARPMMIT